MNEVGKVCINKELLANALLLSKANLINIWEDGADSNLVWCILESPIFDTKLDTEQPPLYELEVSEDRVGNQIIKAIRDE